jgi:hypothetical protein
MQAPITAVIVSILASTPFEGSGFIGELPASGTLAEMRVLTGDSNAVENNHF